MTMIMRSVARACVIAAIAAVGVVSGCKKSGEGGGAARGGGRRPRQYKFAFVTNNSAGFWNIAEKGVEKAEQDLGIKAEVIRPLKGELAEQQRYLEDVMVRDFDGLAVSPVNPDSMTPLLDRVAAKMPVICHDSDAPKSKRISYVGTNNTEAGRAAGTAALKALGDKRKGKVALFVGRIDMQNAIERRAGVEEILEADRPRDPARVPGRHRPRQGEEERRGRAGALPRPGPDDRPLVVQRSVAGGRHPRLVAQGEAGDRRVRRGRGDAEGGRGRSHLRDHRSEAVRVRLSVDEAAQGHRGRQAGAGHRQPGHRHHHARKT